jgi:hypothetical protein
VKKRAFLPEWKEIIPMTFSGGKTMMQRYFLVPILFAALLMLCSCVGSPPTIDEFAKANYGDKPNKKIYESKVKDWFEGCLKDPESAKYKFDKPKKGWYGKTLSNLAGPRKIDYGWIVLVQVNAKNSYGGYTGYKPYHCLFRGEELLWVVDLNKVQWQVEGTGYVPDSLAMAK